MRDRAHRRRASQTDLALTAREFALLQRLTTPERIQRFLNAMPANHEPSGETMLSVRESIAQRRAHCLEGALVAACALWVQGEPPYLMHLDCAPSDYPHVVALYRRADTWGAISKTNSAALRFRDPIYRSLRELALSYFHEYCDRQGRKTLRSYSRAFDLRALDVALWVTNPAPCAQVHDRLVALRHYPLLTSRQQSLLVRRDAFERRAGRLVEYPNPADQTGTNAKT